MSSHDYLKYATPPWMQKIGEQKENGRRVVLLHFNIRDVLFDPDSPPSTPQDLLTIKESLINMMSKRHVVLSYSLHSGIEIHKGGEALQEKTFDTKKENQLWEDVAKYAADNPFALLNLQRSAEEVAPPQHWRVPRYAIPLLTRALTHKYTLKPPRAGQPQQLGESQASPLSIGLLIDYLHHLVPGAGVIPQHAVAEVVESLQRWSTDPALVDHNHLVMLLAPDLAGVHQELQGMDSHIGTIRVGRPDRDERARFLEWLATFEEGAALRAEDDTIPRLANGASGMNYAELRDFVAIMTRHPREWEEQLRVRRSEIIQRESGGLLVPKESRFGLKDVAGYNYVHEYVGGLVERLREGRGDITGVLFTGPPGTGKSFFAGALAHDAGVNVVVMRNVRGMYVGQSERNLEHVLEVARSLAPVVIFVDEIDQAFSNRGRNQFDGSGGVEQRLLGRLLEFMDDKDNLGKVVWVAASNRPDLIDAALLSRFKFIVPFLLPDREACLAMLRDSLPRQAGFQWREGSWTDEIEEAILSGELPDGRSRPVVGTFSGRELETIVRVSLWKAEADEREWNLRSSEPAPVERIVEDKEEKTLVDARYLLEGIRVASVGHDQGEYLRQALLALRSAPFSSELLARAAETALPRKVADAIIDGNEIDKDEIERQLKRLATPYGQATNWG